MTLRLNRWNPLLLVAVVLWSEGRSLGAQVQKDPLTQVLADMRDGKWEQRALAFNRLIALADPGVPVGLSGDTVQKLIRRFPLRVDEIRLSLIHLLETETRAARSLSEDRGDYPGLLAGLVAGLHDRRAINALMDALPNGDGAAIEGLAAFGDEVLDRLIKKMSDDNKSMRVVAAITVSRMLDPKQQPQLATGSRAKVKSALVKQTGDSYYIVRIGAVRGLAKFPGDDVTARLESIAKNDPFSRPGEAGQKANFPVRHAARVALYLRFMSSTVSSAIEEKLPAIPGDWTKLTNCLRF